MAGNGNTRLILGRKIRHQKIPELKHRWWPIFKECNIIWRYIYRTFGYCFSYLDVTFIVNFQSNEYGQFQVGFFRGNFEQAIGLKLPYVCTVRLYIRLVTFSCTKEVILKIIMDQHLYIVFYICSIVYFGIHERVSVWSLALDQVGVTIYRHAHWYVMTSLRDHVITLYSTKAYN